MAEEEKYVNQAFLSVLESALNTLTFSKLETGISIYEKVGWLISRIDYSFLISDSEFAAKDDVLYYGLSVSDTFTTLDLSLNTIVDFNSTRRVDFGTAASGFPIHMPISKSFSDLPGGGLLIPPNPIYIWAKGTSMVAAMEVQARMFYTVKKLKSEDFWELVEQRRMIGA